MSETKTDNLTLGITSIGKLLIDLKNNEIFKEDKNNQPVLKIPDYQRPYKWKPKNVIRLLDDIEEARRANKEKKYRVGTLILCKHEQEENGDNKQGKTDEKKNVIYDIVDGQQRVITFSLLLKCCQKKLGKKNDNIAFLKQELDDNSYNRQNVHQNYQALKRRIYLLKKGDCEDLYEYVKKHCELVVIITKNESEAFQFFDSQNARGKKLYPHDLLKAYHLREMNGFRDEEKEEVVRVWEDIDQNKLSALFGSYLYQLKEWIKGNRPGKLSEKNLDVFKGITWRENFPCAQYHKSAFAYIDSTNKSYIPLVYDTQCLSKFQIDAPVIAGKPFFEYAKHYSDLLKDIQDNRKYVGYFINGDPIVETLNKHYNSGEGNEWVRLLFDSAILLYVDRFCHLVPTREELNVLDQFVEYAFIWAYSCRIQYDRVGEKTAKNYVEGKGRVNSFNIYKIIAESDTPKDLFHRLSEKLRPLCYTKSGNKNSQRKEKIVELKDEDYKKVDRVSEKDSDPQYEIIEQWFKRKGYLNSIKPKKEKQK